MFGPFSYMEWAPLNFPLLIVMGTAILLNYFDKNHRSESAFRNRLIQVLIMMVGAYALRATPLVSSAVDSIHSLENNLFSKVTVEFTPILLIALFVWLSTTQRPKLAKYGRVWLILLIVSVIGFAITANYLAMFLDVFLHIGIWLYNGFNYCVNWFFNIRFSHG